MMRSHIFAIALGAGVLASGFAANGRFGFGFDPESDLSFDQFTVKASTSAVPEPTTMILLGLGLTGLGFSMSTQVLQ